MESVYMWPNEPGLSLRARTCDFCADEITDTIQSVFNTMIRVYVNGDPGPENRRPSCLAAAVRMGAAQSTIVVLECGRQAARGIAQRFLQTKEPPEDDIAADVICELVNIIGGNLKRIIAPGAELCVPHRIHGSAFFWQGVANNVRYQERFRSPVGSFRVSVVMVQESAETDASTTSAGCSFNWTKLP